VLGDRGADAADSTRAPTREERRHAGLASQYRIDRNHVAWDVSHQAREQVGVRLEGVDLSEVLGELERPQADMTSCLDGASSALRELDRAGESRGWQFDEPVFRREVFARPMDASVFV